MGGRTTDSDSLAIGAVLLRSRLEGALFGESPPVRIGRYELLRSAGAGAMGVVYEARDTVLQRRVALKVIRPDRIDAGARARFVREANSMARVTHNNVVTVFDIGEHDGGLFIAMEFIEGPTLAAWLCAGSYSRSSLLAVFKAIAEGLHAAHGAGVVHRDFKPDNVLMADGGRPKVADFGLACMLAAEASTAASAAVMMRSAHVTGTGAVVGTPRYAAPEVLAGGVADARSDQFSFCVALFEALSGAHPFGGSTVAELSDRVQRGTIAWTSAGAVPSHLRALLGRGLARDPTRRWPSMEVLAAALRGRKRPRWPAVVLGVAGLAAVSGAVFGGAERAECAAGAEVAARWSQHQRPALRRALTNAPRERASAEAQVDGFVQAWIRTYDDACEGAASARERDVQLACLAEQRARLEHSVALLGDPEVTPWALRLVETLPTPRRCLHEAAVPALPEDPVLRVEVARGRESLARAAALEEAGKLVAAKDVAVSTLARAQTLGVDALAAEAHARAGSVLVGLGRGEPARHHLERAYALAVADDRTALAGAVASNLSMARAPGGHDREALRWARSAVAMARRADDPEALVVALEALQGALSHAGDFEQALAIHAESWAVAQRVHAPTDAMIGKLLWNRALLDLDMGEYAAARGRAYEALAVLEEAWGPSHPKVGRLVTVLAAIHFQLAEDDKAVALASRARAVLANALGEESPHVGRVLSIEGLATCNVGRVDDGVALLRRAEALSVAAYGEDSSQVWETLDGRCSCLFGAGRYAEAATCQRAALAQVERSPHAGVMRLADSKSNLSTHLLRLGELEEAERLAREALELTAATAGADHPSMTHTYSTLGQILLEQGRFDEAAVHAERALALASEHFAEDGYMVGSAALNASLVEARRGNVDAAERHARAGLSAGHEEGSSLHVKLLVALGEACLLHGRREEARRNADQLLTLTEHGEFGFQRARAQFIKARAAPSRAQGRVHARAALEYFDADEDWESGQYAERVRAWLRGESQP